MNPSSITRKASLSVQEQFQAYSRQIAPSDQSIAVLALPARRKSVSFVSSFSTSEPQQQHPFVNANPSSTIAPASNNNASINKRPSVIASPSITKRPSLPVSRRPSASNNQRSKDINILGPPISISGLMTRSSDALQNVDIGSNGGKGGVQLDVAVLSHLSEIPDEKLERGSDSNDKPNEDALTAPVIQREGLKQIAQRRLSFVFGGFNNNNNIAGSAAANSSSPASATSVPIANAANEAISTSFTASAVGKIDIIVNPNTSDPANPSIIVTNITDSDKSTSKRYSSKADTEMAAEVACMVLAVGATMTQKRTATAAGKDNMEIGKQISEALGEVEDNNLLNLEKIMQTVEVSQSAVVQNVVAEAEALKRNNTIKEGLSTVVSETVSSPISSSIARDSVGEFSSHISIISVLEKFDHWNWEIFDLHELTQGWPLFSLAHFLFYRSDLYTKLKIPKKQAMRFLTFIERGYHDDVPYHNSIHATDVLHGITWLKDRCSQLIAPTDIELLSLYVAAIIHDFE